MAGLNLPRNGRMSDIDNAKGLAILLVVFGHIFSNPYSSPYMDMWYLNIHSVIYHFHMPFFMYLSGVVTFYSGHHQLNSKYGKFIARQAYKLLIPFITLGLLVVVGKTVCYHFMPVDRPPDQLGEGVISLLWNTGESPARFIWYIFVLFVFRAATPVLNFIFKGSIHLLLIFALILFWIDLPGVLFLPRIGSHYLFFVLGGAFALNQRCLSQLIDRYCMLFLFVFVALCVFEYLPLSFKEWTFVAGLASIPAIHGLMRLPCMQFDFLNYVGTSTYTIYLFNTIFIGLAKAMLLQVIPLNGHIYFVLYVIVLFAAGVCCPMLLRRYVLQKVRLLTVFA